MCCHFVLLLRMLLLSLQWLLSLTPHLSSPHPRVWKGLGNRGGRYEGQKGVLQHNQTPVSLVATQKLAVSTYITVQLRVDEQSYNVRQHWAGELLPEALQYSEKNRKAKFKFPQSLLEPLLRLLGSWRFGEPGSGKRPAIWPRLSPWTGKWFLSGPHGLPHLWFSLSAVFPCIQS